MIRCAIYCRVSTADQNCQRQERELLEYAQKAGYEVVGVYQETASGAKDDRTKRAKVMALAQRRKINVVLVTEMTRWGRSTPDLINTLYELQSKGVSLIAQSGLQFDLSTPQGKLVASVMAAFAEFERDLIRERVKSGLAAARAKGKRLGRPPLSLLIKSKVLAAKAEGKSYTQISVELGISRSSVFGIVRTSS